jgi:spermidine/putrescine transport system substrate-binding protein
MRHSPRPNLTLPRVELVGRRRFLQGLGALALGGPLLAACGDDGEPSPDEASGSDAEAASEVRMSNWPLYIDEETLADFEAATGITVAYTEDINDNEEYFAKIREPLSRGQDVGADLFVPSNFLVERLIGLEWLAELDDANIPNKDNLEPSLLDPPFDEGRRYSLPWFSGFTAIAYNRDLTGREITSLSELFNPEFAGQVSFFSDFRDGLGLVIKSMGISLTEATREDVQAAADMVAEAKAAGQIRRFTGNDYGDDLVAGNLAIAMAYSGDVAQLQLDNPALEFVFPEEGMGLFVDNMVIPITAEPGAKAAAEAFMNYVYDPVNNAKLTNWVQFISPVQGVGDELAKIDPELAENPLINPPSEVRDLAEDWRPLTEEEDVEFSAIYNEVVSS